MEKKILKAIQLVDGIIGFNSPLPNSSIINSSSCNGLLTFGEYFSNYNPRTEPCEFIWLVDVSRCYMSKCFKSTFLFASFYHVIHLLLVSSGPREIREIREMWNRYTSSPSNHKLTWDLSRSGKPQLHCKCVNQN